MMTTEERNRRRRYRAAIRRGIALLDVVEPKWRKKVDLSFLDLASGSMCILGQVAKGYLTGLSKFAAKAAKHSKRLSVKLDAESEIPFLAANYYGFSLPLSESELENWDLLTLLWKEALTK